MDKHIPAQVGGGDDQVGAKHGVARFGEDACDGGEDALDWGVSGDGWAISMSEQMGVRKKRCKGPPETRPLP